MNGMKIQVQSSNRLHLN